MLFKLLVLIYPLAGGLIIVGIFAATPNKNIKTKMLYAEVFLLSCILLLLLIGLISKQEIATLLKSILFIMSFCIFVSSVFLLLRFIGIGNLLSQVITSIFIVLQIGSIFYFDPIIEACLEKKVSQNMLSQVVDIAFSINPYAIIQGSIFEINVQRDTALYHLFLISEVSHWTPPAWYRPVLIYLFFSLAVALLHICRVLIKNLQHK